MFGWTRSRDMPSDEPTEEQIWDVIEAYDPHYSISVRERSSWYHEMLEGRNIFGNAFTRSSRMIPYDSELPSGHNPTDWIIDIFLRHSHEAPLEKIVDRLNTGTQSVLQPASDDLKSTGIVRLLSYYLLCEQAKDWDPRSVFGTPLSIIGGYTEWGRYHLQIHHKILKKAGIYKAIYASLFDYSRLPFAWIRGIAERWDKTTNTCWIGPHELTITLADMQNISGLPVWGTPYEECIPPDHELFQRQGFEQKRKGNHTYSGSLHRALFHYKTLAESRRKGRKKNATITLEDWTKTFISKDMCSAQYARLNDPFSLAEQASETSFRKRFESEKNDIQGILAHNIDEDLSLVAFIATWLCYFVFPGKNKLFRPSTLLMASLMARGERVAIAPAVLAYIYHGLGRVSVMTDSRRYDIEAPWHYLHGWIFEHISGSFSCPETPPFFKEEQYPLIMQLSKATASVNMVQIRTFMFAPDRMTDRFQISYQSQPCNVCAQDLEKRFEDTRTKENTPLLLSEPSYQGIAEYFIGMRPAWLCYRRHESIILEGYNPNRAARQYGFTQATPLNGLPQIMDIDNIQALGKLSLSIRLKVASEAWAFLLRMGTGSHFYIAPKNASTGVSHIWLTWIRRTFSSFLERGFKVYSNKLQRPRYTGPSSANRSLADKNDKQKRARESTSTHEGFEAECSKQNRKKKRALSPLICQIPVQNEPTHEQYKAECSKQIRKKERVSSPLIYQTPVSNEPIQLFEGVEVNNATAEDYIPLPEDSESVQSKSLPVLEEIIPRNLRPNLVPSGPPSILEEMTSENHQPSSIRSEPILILEEILSRDPQPEQIMSRDLRLDDCNEVVASTSASVHSSLNIVTEQLILELQENGAMSRNGGETSITSQVQCPIAANTNNSVNENVIVITTDESSLPESIQQEDTSISGELLIENINEITETQQQESLHPSSILEPISGFEISNFISEIRMRTAGSSRARFSRSLGNILTTLRELVLEINIETLPDLTEFREMTNSLLDCAVISGIDAQDLQQWESLLRDIEYGIYSIQIAREENSVEEIETAKAIYEDISKRTMIAYENLQEKHTASRICQKNMMWASAEIFRIMFELEKLKKRKQYLIQKKEIVNQDIVVMENDFSQIGIEISELEQIYNPLSQQLEIATQNLQAIKNKNKHKIAQARAAMTRIREIQSGFV